MSPDGVCAIGAGPSGNETKASECAHVYLCIRTSVIYFKGSQKADDQFACMYCPLGVPMLCSTCYCMVYE